MKARCIQDGMAFIVGMAKARWCEVGQEHDLDVKRMGGMPKHFEKIEKEKKDPPAPGAPAPGAPTTTDL